MNFKELLIADWQWVLKYSWSLRLVALSAALSGAEALLPQFTDSIPHGVFAVLSLLVTAAAAAARFALQKREAEEADGG